MSTVWGDPFGSSPWPGGTWESAPWTIDLHDRTGTLVTADVPWMTASVTWTLDGPGACEVSLREDEMTSDWVSGLRRIVINRGSTPAFGGWLTHLAREGRPDRSKAGYKAAAQGLSSILDYRVVHGDFSEVETVTTGIAWQLIVHAQAQANGNMGLTLGAVDGTAPARTRDFCDGDVIGDAIRELAAMDVGGFDWEISPTGAFRAWVGGRGDPSGLTITDAESLDFSIVSETSDLATYATGMGDADEPCGPALVTVEDDLASSFGRREVVVDVDSNDSDDLTDAATQELAARRDARLQVTGSWLEERMPWGWGEVWLGDFVTVTLPGWFGGEQPMQVYQIDASLEPGHLVFVTYRFRAIESPPLLVVANTSHAHTIEAPVLTVPFDPLSLSPAAYYDWGDPTTLFTDAGITQVTTDGDLIYQVNDKSGNNKHLTQVGSTERPTYKENIQNGLSASRFDGGDYWTSALAAGTETFTWFVVAEHDDFTNYHALIGASGSGGFSFRPGKTGDNPGKYQMLKQAVALIATSDVTLSANTPFIAVCTYTAAGAFQIWVNGGAKVSGTNDQTLTASSVEIGRGAAENHVGDAFAAIRFDYVLSLEEINDVAGFFADRWNIAWTEAT